MDSRRTVGCLLALVFALLLWLSADQSVGAGHALYEGDPPEVRGVLFGRPVACGASRLGASSTISKTAPSDLAAGDSLTYTISVFDSGGAISGVVTDAVPANCEYLAGSMTSDPSGATITQPVASGPGNVLTWTVDSSTSPVTLTFAVAPILPITDGEVLTNEAWVDGAVSAPATTTIHSSPDLHLTKTAQPAIVTGGDPLTYTLAVTNTGTGIATNLVVTDVVPAHTTYQSGSMAVNPPDQGAITQPIASGPGNVMTWTLSSLAGAVSLTFQVAVDRPITDGTVIANTAWLQGAAAVATSTVSSSPSLQFTKTGRPLTVTGGGLLTYTLAVSNTGPGIALDVVVTDTVPDHTTFQPGSMTTDPLGLATATEPATPDPGQVMTWTLPALADRVDLTFQVAVDRPITDGIVITNAAWLQGATAIATSTVSAAPDLHLTKTAQPAIVTGGSLLTYTLSVTNIGAGIATQVVVTDVVPAHTTYQSGSMAANPLDQGAITQPVASGPGNVMTWTLSSLSGAVSLTFQVAVDRPITDGIVITNAAWLQGATAIATSTVSAAPTLWFTKAARPTTVTGGSLLTYTLSVTNIGAGIATQVVVTDVVPAHTTYQSGSMAANPPDQGAITQPVAAGPGNVMTWTLPNLADRVDLSFQVAVDRPITNGLTLTNTAWLQGATAVATSTVSAAPTLWFAKAARPTTVTGGSLLTYTLSVTNIGAGIATHVVVTDVVPAHTAFQPGSMAATPPGLAIATAPAAPGPGQVMTWTLPSLSGAVSLTFGVTVDRPITNGIVITNTAWLQGATAVATSTVSSSPSLQFTKAGRPSTVTGGGLLTYTLSVTNSGTGIAANVVVTDAVPDHTAYQTGSMAANSPDQVVMTQPAAPGPGRVMTWTLPTLAGTVDLSFRVTVDRPITDGTVIANTAWLQGATASTASTVSAAPSLHLAKTVSPSTVHVGELLTYTLTLSNDGTGIAQGVVLTDRLPAGAVFTAMVQGETPATTSPELTWNDLTVAANHVLTFTATAPLRSGSYFNQAAATVDGIRLETGPSAVVQVTSITRTVDLPIVYRNYQCTRDPYEGPSGNDSPQTAYRLASNTTLFANFCESGNKDEYKFSVSGAGVPIHATLSQIPPGCDYDLYLYSMANLNTPKATSKRPGGQDESVQYQPQSSEAGEFLLLVHAFSKCAGAGSSDYQLAVVFQ